MLEPRAASAGWVGEACLDGDALEVCLPPLEERVRRRTGGGLEVPEVALWRGTIRVCHGRRSGGLAGAV
jgi:hypothetical protein